MKTFGSFLYVAILFSFFFSPDTSSQVIHVPADFSNIQDAINASSHGDTVLVSDGFYEGTGNMDIKLNGKEIVVRSSNGPEACIIDGSSGGSYSAGFVSGYVPVSNNAVIEGFTIQNFSMVGFYIFGGSSPVIKNNLIKNCKVAIACGGGSGSLITENEIRENSHDLDNDGIISLASSGVTLFRNRIIENEASGLNAGIIYCAFKDSSAIWSNTIKDNLGCAIVLKNTRDVTITGNEISGNRQIRPSVIQEGQYDEFNRPYQLVSTFEQIGGAVALISNASAIVSNNLILQNTAYHTGGIFCDETSFCAILNNDVLKNASLIGGGITIKNPSSVIMNNIVAGSRVLSTGERLERWFYNNLFMQIQYEGGKRSAVRYFYGIKNNGEAGEVRITGKIDTSFTILPGEHYWLETTSLVTETGDGGGIDIVIQMGDDTIVLDVDLEAAYNGSCIKLYDTRLQSFGTFNQGGIPGAGILTIGEAAPFPGISYNDIYGNAGSARVWQPADASDLSPGSLPDDAGNLSQDPMIRSADFTLMEGSPCIDAGNPDDTYNDAALPPGLGTARNDIGVYGGPLNSQVELFTEAGCIPSESIVNDTACDWYDFNGRILDASGTYYDTLCNARGCDSVIILNLRVISLDTAISLNISTLVSNEAHADYQWIDCDQDYKPVSGATSRSFAPSVPGNYAVIVTRGICTDTSECHSVLTVGKEKDILHAFPVLYPNPTTGDLHFDLGAAGHRVSVRVLDITGKVVAFDFFEKTDTHVYMTLEGHPGVYFLQLMTGEGLTTWKVIKK